VILGFVKEVSLAEPFSWLGFRSALWGHVLALCGLIALLLGAFGAGRPVVMLAGLKGVVVGVAGLACGWGVISLINHGLGLTGLYFPAVLRMEACVLPALGLWSVIRDRAWKGAMGLEPRDRLPVGAIVVLILGALMLTRLPDTNEDARQGHFAGPEQYLLLHKVEAEAQHMAWHMARGAEMVNLVPWHLGGIDGAKLVNVGWLVTLVLVVAGLSRALGGGGREDRPSASDGGGGWWGAMLAASAGMVMSEVWEGKNDLGQAAGILGGLWCSVKAITGRGGGRWWLVAGWLMGSAMGVKYTAGFYVAGLAAAVAWEKGVRFEWGRMAVVAGVFVVPFIGWMWESWLFLGNPVYPFMSGMIPTLGWGPFYERAMHDVIGRVSPEEVGHRWDALSGVWRVIGDPGMGNPALFAVLPLAVLGRRVRGGGFMLVLMAVVWGLWGMTERTARYMYVAGVIGGVLGALVVEGGVGEAGEWARSRALRYALAGVAMWYVGMRWVMLGGSEGWKVLVGTESREGYLGDRYTTWWDAVKWLNGNVRAGGRVYFTGEERRLWLSMRVRSSAVVTEPLFWRLTKDSYTAGEVRKRVKQLGLTHHLHNFVSAEYRGITWFQGPPWAERQLKTYAEFTRVYLRPAYAPTKIDYNNGGFYIFQITRDPFYKGYPLLYLPTTEGCFHRPMQLLGSGRGQEAVNKARDLVYRMRGVAESWFMLARIYAFTRNGEKSFRAVEKTVAGGMISGENYRLYAGTALYTGRVDIGLKACCRGLCLNRTGEMYRLLADGFVMKADRLVKRGEYAKAEGYLSQAMSCAPDYVEPKVGMVGLLVKLGRFREAYGIARAAQALDRGNLKVGYYLSRIGKNMVKDARK
jgi:hypothetical protein